MVEFTGNSYGSFTIINHISLVLNRLLNCVFYIGWLENSVLFQEMIHLTHVLKFIYEELLVVFPYILLRVTVFVVIPVSFRTLVLSLHPSFYLNITLLVSLANSLSVFLNYVRNQLFVSLIFFYFSVLNFIDFHYLLFPSFWFVLF